MYAETDALYRLLPAYVRTRDPQGEPALRELLAIVGEQAAALQNDIRRTYDGWFIETCDGWLVPYIADLLGTRMGCFLFQLPPSFHYTPARLKNILGQLDPVAPELEQPPQRVPRVGAVLDDQHVARPRRRVQPIGVGRGVVGRPTR